MTAPFTEHPGPAATGIRDVEVWSIPLLQPPEVIAALLDDLDTEERRRAARNPRYGVAHGAVRRILAARAGCAAAELRRTAGPNGKPGLAGPGADLGWNLSASGDWALLALLPTAPGPGVSPSRPDTPVAVGVDVQILVPTEAALGLARRYFPAAEARQVESPGADARADSSPGAVYTRLWAYKEAYVKVFGGQLMQGLGVTVPAGPSGTMDGPLGRCRVAAVPGPAPDYRAAVAVTGESRPRPCPRTWAYEPAAAG
ncbi:4'-phosphopantetheinyl transferase family protein [Streptomyces polygonati]|uniref:4'-phosphopantetheinyl transferase family protein n=1 Tax=Streptomyces polygonati TaxID=1617087 RepID=A0ABV8HNJ7_9ACTN